MFGIGVLRSEEKQLALIARRRGRTPRRSARCRRGAQTVWACLDVRLVVNHENKQVHSRPPDLASNAAIRVCPQVEISPLNDGLHAWLCRKQL
jgi:hypothetical protein